MAGAIGRIIALLFVWQVFTLEVGAAGDCANGFIQLNALSTLAQKIPNGQLSNNALNSELRLIPGWNFTCGGTITSFLLGADIRPVISSRTLYPQVQIWRSSTSSMYMKVWSEEIRLNAGSFSPSGVLEYHLDNPFNFQAGDFFGIYQPGKSSSVVRVYYNDSDSTAPVALKFANNTSIYNLDDNSFTSVPQQFILISPITDPSCTNGFANPVELQNKVLDVNIYNDRRRLQEQRVFPDINFTCTGSLTKWIVARTVGDMVGGEVQIWRRNAGSENDYTKIGFSILNATDPDNDNVFEHIPNSPLNFQEGDILGVYQRNGQNRTAIYYHTTTGPANYRNPFLFNTDPPAPATLNGATLVASQYDYPLVTVEISVSVPTSSVQAQTSTLVNSITSSQTVVLTTSAPFITSHISSFSVDEPLKTNTSISMPTTAVTSQFELSSSFIAITTSTAATDVMTTPSVSIPASTTPNADSTGVSGAAVGGAIAALLLLALFAAAGISIVIVVLVKRRNVYKSTTLAGDRSGPQFENPLYTSHEKEEGDLAYLTVELYGRKDTYDVCDSTFPLEHDNAADQYYSPVKLTENKEPLYWTPADNCPGIYEQFSSKGFREIAPDQIQTTTKLGSGHFGCVKKGVWHSPEGRIDVAIKTLQDGSPKEELVKFLQEAAIMGQFHHPNVVKLHGVVTVGESIKIVLELMSQDLRDHLFALRPCSGELAPSSLPQQLLRYCRQIASGMEYLSKKSFVHRDLAARNILVNDERTCKIADFGMSRDLEDENYYTSRGGMIPMKWTAIEAILFKKYSTASDVWSFGVLMYEIWSLGHKPFEDVTNPKAVEMIRNGVRLSPPPGCPRAIYELMMQCWHPEKSERPSFTNLVSGLSQPDEQLLNCIDSDKTHPQSTMLGAPLDTASNLYSDLQQQYLN